MVQLPNLEIHDMPDGVVLPDAFCIQWLQDILDFWYHMMPFSATVKSVALNSIANQDYILLPSDFILDVRNGYATRTIPTDPLSVVRRHRVSLQKFINRKLALQKSTNINYPYFYCVQDADDATGQQMMQITPTPNIAVVGIIWYYALPPILTAGDKPKFPNDYVCVEYLRIRACEWAHIYEPGTAQKFCDKVVSGMKAAGLMNEPEDDEIPFDDLTFRKGGGTAMSSYGWMGER